MANNNHFELTLDTLAPTGSITRPAAIINANDNLAIVKNDAVYMKVWFNDTAIGTKSDAEYPSTPEAALTEKMTNFSTDGTYYYHMILIDDVNNESTVFNTAAILFDSTDPVVVNTTGHAPYMADPDTGSHLITNNLTGVEYYFEYNDGTGDGVSGVVSATITGDDIDPIPLNLSSSNTSYQGTLDFKSGTLDGTKTISIVVTDAAGNSSTAVTASIVLDTALTKPVLTLQNNNAETLPAYINFTGIKVSLTSSETDIVGYKLWEGNNEPADYTTQTAGTLNILQSVTLSGEGAHTFHAKVKDSSGNEVSADDRTVTLDTSNPAVSILSDVNIVSKVSGHNAATLTLGGTDSVSGVASYTLTVGAVTLDSGAVVPASYSLTNADLESMAEGSNTFTLTVVDNAGNSNSATCSIILDTTAPSIQIGQLNTWYNAYFDVSTVLSDTNGVSTIYAWSDATADNTTKPQDCQGYPAAVGNHTITSAQVYWSPYQDAANYLHVMLVDTVGNVGYAHAQFGYDNVAPGTPVVNFSSGVYTSTSAEISIQYSDATSGVAYMRVTGDISDPTANESWEAITTPRSVTLTSGDGMKSVYVIVKDNAGNESTISSAAQTELDTTTPTAGIILYEADGTTLKPAHSPVASLSARVSVTNDDPYGGCEYKIYGDFTFDSQSAQGIAENDAPWTAYTPDSGQSYKTISDMYCTSGDGNKYVYVKIRDNAGHISSEAHQLFDYDTTAPEVDITDIDYNRISKEHSLRRGVSGPISDKYADECTFVWEPASAERYQAYKVVAYDDATAAAAGSHADNAIPTTGGSVNMSATGLNQNTAVTSMIKGADFEAALGTLVDPGDFDGAHIVVVYIQDLGGTWSVAATFNA